MQNKDYIFLSRIWMEYEWRYLHHEHEIMKLCLAYNEKSTTYQKFHLRFWIHNQHLRYLAFHISTLKILLYEVLFGQEDIFESKDQMFFAWRKLDGTLHQRNPQRNPNWLQNAPEKHQHGLQRTHNQNGTYRLSY